MNLSKLTKKTLEVSRGFTYAYYTSAAQNSKPTVALFHGWPDTARLWAGFINDYLVPNGYGVLALDCLGYGGSSKPTDKALYTNQHIAADIVEILDAEKLYKVVSLGHDWGSVIAQRLYNYHPSRVAGLVLVNVCYMPPNGDFDLDKVNEVTKQEFGHGLFEYWSLFAAEDGPELMNSNIESVYSAAFTNPYSWINTWCTPGAMRAWVTEGRTAPTLPFATPEHKADFMERFSQEPGFAAAQCPYQASASKLQNEADKEVPEEAKIIRVPVFYWGGEQDFVCRPVLLQANIDGGFLPNVKSKPREGGHWALLERPAEFGQDVLGWLQETF
ncbi:epoxide hydrolase 2 [Colletotrichum sojae]|uniref:Epoxide hydrolase 2 n=1 Tax=Colletotrichum sojae TaxID=2175907 RepID=A0A8H6N663_9PEZI|nr:epoxide hydrolase 2 [Colletotrichum sojae]